MRRHFPDWNKPLPAPFHPRTEKLSNALATKGVT